MLSRISDRFRPLFPNRKEPSKRECAVDQVARPSIQILGEEHKREDYSESLSPLARLIEPPTIVEEDFLSFSLESAPSPEQLQLIYDEYVLDNQGNGAFHRAILMIQESPYIPSKKYKLLFYEVKRLFSIGVDPLCVNKAGENALHLLATIYKADVTFDYLDMIDAFLEAKIDPHAPNHTGKTAAQLFKEIHAIKPLLDRFG